MTDIAEMTEMYQRIIETLAGVLLPFFGTALGAACVFFAGTKKRAGDRLGGGIGSALSGFAAGVMTAASVWSLLLPAIGQSERLGRLAFLPAAAGMLAGTAFLLLLDAAVKMPDAGGTRERETGRKKTALLVFAVTLHNVPEGMAVGVAFAALLYGGGMTLMGAYTLALGIAVQNIPEGAIISLPVCSGGKGRGESFLCGVLSGIVEPAAALLTLLLSSLILPLLPYLLSFAAGAMICVSVCELIPEACGGDFRPVGTASLILGFVLMMALDVALG